MAGATKATLRKTFVYDVCQSCGRFAALTLIRRYEVNGDIADELWCSACRNPTIYHVEDGVPF
ncbi:MAG TPA: hypothetical protein DEU95_10470 [Chloroflexi bacterium]|jgi:uncharacterized protein YbaR (Trm112 family)|nr:hypothetical protein [Chloroflexota bacterium]HBY44736.1 hypothetical protein [Chloroflexota bacterium]HCG30141.1 hypothetical protein [Chloroflexota bacterium]